MRLTGREAAVDRAVMSEARGFTVKPLALTAKTFQSAPPTAAVASIPERDLERAITVAEVTARFIGTCARLMAWANGEDQRTADALAVADAYLLFARLCWRRLVELAISSRSGDPNLEVTDKRWEAETTPVESWTPAPRPERGPPPGARAHMSIPREPLTA